jgi:hypothetical protein
MPFSFLALFAWAQQLGEQLSQFRLPVPESPDKITNPFVFNAA